MVQEESKFFRFLWRVDAILLALAGVLLIGVLSTLLVEAWTMRHSYQPVPEGHFAPVPKTAEQSYTYRLSEQPEFALLAQEQFYALQRYKGAPSSYGLADVTAGSSSVDRFNDAVNLLAVNTITGASHWLFEGYKRAVVDQQSIYGGGPPRVVPAPGEPLANPIAIVIRTVDKDTNNDGRFDLRDRQALYYYQPGNQRASKFFEADYIISMREVQGGNFLVVYEKGQSAIAATFRVPDFKLLSQHKLPDVPQ
jgi:hypothetical protein